MYNLNLWNNYLFLNETIARGDNSVFYMPQENKTRVFWYIWVPKPQFCWITFTFFNIPLLHCALHVCPVLKQLSTWIWSTFWQRYVNCMSLVLSHECMMKFLIINSIFSFFFPTSVSESTLKKTSESCAWGWQVSMFRCLGETHYPLLWLVDYL